MKRIVQIHTGGWHNQLYTSHQIIERIQDVLKRMPIDGVIIGWHLNARLYQEVGEFLKKQGIEMYAWLPVFSEIGELGEVDSLIDLWGNKTEKYVLQEGESFEFCCPSSLKNRNLLFKIYDHYFSECQFDGVFLDKIRTQSFIPGAKDVLGCCCDVCKESYEDEIVALKQLIEETNLDEALMVNYFEPTTGFHFKHKQAEDFFISKKKLYTSSISQITNHFKNLGLKVGFDVYAPMMAGLVGQDIKELLEMADFIKPMMYRRTNAPAGVTFEYEAMKKALPNNPFDEVLNDSMYPMSAQLFKDQLNVPNKDKIYPGIEVNYRADIAPTDLNYVKDSVNVATESGCGGIVYSWDIMLAPDEHLQ